MKYLKPIFLLLLLSQISFAQPGWVQKYEESDVLLYSIDMPDANTITAVGVDGTLLYSSDAGATWTHIDAGTTTNLRRVRWHSPSLAVILGNDGLAMKSTNGGTVWTKMNTGINSSLLDIHFFDTENWLVIGQAARVITTSDAGATWEDQGASTNNYNEISFHGDFGVIAGNQGTIRGTTDGGKKWKTRTSPITLELTSVSVGDDSTAIIVGLNGTILRTSDYGITWDVVYASIPLSALRLTNVRHLTRDRAVIVGYGGVILETTDSGLTWTPQQSNTQKNIQAVAFSDNKIGNTAGWDGTIMRTTNGGTLAVIRSSAAPPVSLRINSAWPQPVSHSASASAHIQFDLPVSGSVELRVYDLLGRERASILSRTLQSGSWDISWNPSELRKGVYLYHLTVNSQARTKKFVVVD
jgi:photosystem II stability/assembly factor-like uncharacterized protein